MDRATVSPEWAELVQDAGLLIERFQVTLRAGHGAVVEYPLAPSGPKPEITDKLQSLVERN
jgi:hypothetical protein